MLALFASLFLGVSSPATGKDFGAGSLAPATPAKATALPGHGRATYAAQITGDWQPNREAAWRDARLKAFETALGPYRIVGSSIAVKGAQRRVKLSIEWTE